MKVFLSFLKVRCQIIDYTNMASFFLFNIKLLTTSKQFWFYMKWFARFKFSVCKKLRRSGMTIAKWMFVVNFSQSNENLQCFNSRFND